IEGDASFQPLEDGSLLVVGAPDPNSSYELAITAEMLQRRSTAEESIDSPQQRPHQKIAALKLRVLSDDALPRRGPGLASNGNFVLTGLNVVVGEQQVRPASAFADHEQPGYAVTGAIDSDPKTGWAINVGPRSTKVMNADH